MNYSPLHEQQKVSEIGCQIQDAVLEFQIHVMEEKEKLTPK